VEEDAALLTGRHTGKITPLQSGNAAINAHRARSKWREMALFVWALIATTAVVVLAGVWQNAGSSGSSSNGSIPSGKRNLIFMVSDGMGPTSLSLTRSWRHTAEGVPYDEALILDQYLIGQSRTRSTSSLITDSAAGATAFSCGLKSYNGAISILPDGSPCGSVMEAAKRAGYTTGLVVTTRITDATPAVFASHARRRELEDGIARQMIGETHPLGRVVDLMFGGGRCHFLPNTSEGSCRKDQLDVIKTAKKQNWGYISTKPDFDALNPDKAHLPLLALFAPTDIPYEIDRLHQTDLYPSLKQMATTALETLASVTANSEQGFFIMIEGSRIDHAGHANDPAAQVHEVLAYDATIAAVLDFIASHEKETGTPTLMVSTSDHETGGLAVAKQLTREYPEYLWLPSVLANVSHSAGFVAHEYHRHMDSHFPHHAETSNSAAITGPETRAYLSELSASYLGIHDADDKEIDLLIQDPAIAAYTFADMVSRRAQTGWSTHGHSGADVNIYSSDASVASALVGTHENTEVGAFLRTYLGVEKEVEAITHELQKRAHDSGSVEAEVWLGKIPDGVERLDGQDHVEHYEGSHKPRRDFRRHEGRGLCEVCGL